MPFIYFAYLQNIITVELKTDETPPALPLMIEALKCLYGEIDKNDLENYLGALSAIPSLKLLYKSILKWMEKRFIDTKQILIHIPYKKTSKMEGMTEKQYSDYVLGYKIMNECLDSVIIT